MNGSEPGSVALPERPLRLHLLAEDEGTRSRLEHLLRLARVQTGILWAEADGPGPDVLSLVHGSAEWLRTATPGDEAGGRLLLEAGSGLAEALLGQPRPVLPEVTAAGDGTWALAGDLPAFAWRITVPGPGLVVSLMRQDCHPTLDLDVPWAEHAARRLADALAAAAPEGGEVLQLPHLPGGAAWGIALSHDVDYLVTTVRYRATRSYYMAYALRDRGSNLAAARHFIRQGTARRPWDHLRSLEAEASIGASSDWFVFVRLRGNFGGPRSWALNPQYYLSHPLAAPLFARAVELGHPIGLHASPESSLLPELLEEEHTTLEQATGVRVSGVRHHLGRFHWPQSSVGWRACGFEYDSSFILNDAHGYRLGTAMVVPIDLPDGSRVTELSATWMDASAYNFERKDAAAIEASLCALVDRARRRGGLESVVWHDIPIYDDGGTGAYGNFLNYAAAQGGLLAPFGVFATHSRRLIDARIVRGGDGWLLEAAPDLLKLSLKAFGHTRIA